MKSRKLFFASSLVVFSSIASVAAGDQTTEPRTTSSRFDNVNFQTFSQGSAMGLSGDFFGYFGHLLFGDDIRTRIGFTTPGAATSTAMFLDNDINNEAYGFGGNLWVPVTNIGGFPIYADFGFNTLTSEVDDRWDLIRASGTAGGVPVQYDFLAFTGNPNDSNGGGLRVNAAFGSDIRNGHHTLDYGEVIFKGGVATAIDFNSREPAPIVLMPKLSGLYGAVNYESCFSGQTGLNLATPVNFNLCDDIVTHRYGVEFGADLIVPLLELAPGLIFGFDMFAELRAIYNDVDYDASTRTTGAVTINQDHSRSDQFFDFGAVVGGGPFIGNDNIRLESFFVAETWRIGTPILVSDRLSIDETSRFNYSVGARLTVDTGLLFGIAGLPNRSF